MQTKLPVLLSRDLVKLVVIDSTAALFRCEYAVTETAQRARDMAGLASRLHNISAHYNIPIVCVNQVSHLSPSNRLEILKYSDILKLLNNSEIIVSSYIAFPELQFVTSHKNNLHCICTLATK